jgi:hypothetical protein
MLVKRLIHLGLLLLALTGLAGQYTVYAATFDRMATPMQMSPGSPACDDLAQPEPGKVPCKKVGLQCLAAIGFPALTIADPARPSDAPGVAAPMKSVPALADALHGRSDTPELEPPSHLI